MRSDLPGPQSAAIFKSRRAAGQARRLRKALTPAEQALWRELRCLLIEGSHFRKQAAFGPYIVDFICHGAKLVIELDGGAHLAPDRTFHDRERDEWIASRGYKVLRIKNEQVLADVSGVTREILEYVR